MLTKSATIWLILAAAGCVPLTDTKAASEVDTQPDAAAPAPSSAGPCDSAPQTQRLRDWPPRLQEISRTDGLWLDPTRAAVLDVSDATHPRLRGALSVGALLEVTPVAERRLVAALSHRPPDVISTVDSATRFPDALLLLGFDDPDAPKQLANIEIPGEVALITATPDKVLVISDELDLRCQGPTKQSFLYSFTFTDDTLVQLDKVPLGDDLAAAERRGDYLVLIDGTYLHVSHGQGNAPSLRVVSLKQAGSPVISEAAEAPFAGGTPPAIALAANDTALTLVGQDVKVSTGLRFLRYDLTDAAAPRVSSDCLNSTLDSIHLDGSTKVSVLGDRILLAGGFAAIGNGPVINKLVEVNVNCEKQRERSTVALIDVPEAAVAIEVSVNDVRALETRLLDATHATPVATATVDVAQQLDVSQLEISALANIVAFARGTQTERGLLGVAVGQGELQLFSFSASTISARGSLNEANRLSVPIANGVATSYRDSTSHDVLATFALDDASDASRSALGKLGLPVIDN